MMLIFYNIYEGFMFLLIFSILANLFIFFLVPHLPRFIDLSRFFLFVFVFLWSYSNTFYKMNLAFFEQ